MFFVFPISFSILLCYLCELHPQTLLPSGSWLGFVNERIKEKINRWSRVGSSCVSPLKSTASIKRSFRVTTTALSPGPSNYLLFCNLRLIYYQVLQYTLLVFLNPNHTFVNSLFIKLFSIIPLDSY